jgi:hypothetical protein
VKNHACYECKPGSTHAFGADASQAKDTECDVTICEADHYVVKNKCVKVDAGYSRPAGDKATGPDTRQIPVFCKENEFVDSHKCKVCPKGTKAAGGADARGEDTYTFPDMCEPVICEVNEHVVDFECKKCPEGQRSMAMKASKGNTNCIGGARFEEGQESCPDQPRFDIMVCDSYMCNECYTQTCTEHCQKYQMSMPGCKCAHWSPSRKSFSGGDFEGKGGFGDKGDYKQSASADATNFGGQNVLAISGETVYSDAESRAPFGKHGEEAENWGPVLAQTEEDDAPVEEFLQEA